MLYLYNNLTSLGGEDSIASETVSAVKMRCPVTSLATVVTNGNTDVYNRHSMFHFNLPAWSGSRSRCPANIGYRPLAPCNLWQWTTWDVQVDLEENTEQTHFALVCPYSRDVLSPSISRLNRLYSAKLQSHDDKYLDDTNYPYPKKFRCDEIFLPWSRCRSLSHQQRASCSPF